MKTILSIAFACALVLAGCSKNEDQQAGKTTQTPTLDQARSPQLAMEAAQQKRAAAAPKGDKSVPLESYQDIKSGSQLAIAYYALEGTADYEKLAWALSNEYRYTQDEFKKRDIVNNLKPGVDREIAKAKENRYYRTGMGNQYNLGKYDFETKSFPLNTLQSPDASIYYNDASDYRLGFANWSKYQNLKVDDEVAARMIESLRSKMGSIKIVGYVFAAETELGKSRIVTEIMRMQIQDHSGRVLAEIQ